MKKIIIRFLFIVFLTIFTSVVYLSTVGIQTNRLNNQIVTSLKDFNKDLEIELKKIKIVLDPFKLQINAKTIGSNFKINDKTIEIESIKTQISINSFIKNNFSIKNLDISTKSLEINNLISFIRNFKNTPELYLLEKILKKGYLISDISLEFDENGRIKNNYKIRGFVKNCNISLLNKYVVNEIDTIFDITHNNTILKNTNFFFNKIPLTSKEIILQKNNNNFLVKGSIENKDIILDDQTFTNLIKKYFSGLDLINLNFNSKNKFSFYINKKFKINDLKLFSEVQINNLRLVNNFKLKNFFPNIKDKIDLNNHLIQVNFDNKNLSIKGDGNILFQNEEDKINYRINIKDKVYKFETTVSINKNPLFINFLNYRKKDNIKSNLNLNGSYFLGIKTEIDSFSFKENKNNFNIRQLVFDKKFKLKKFKKINLNYFDEDLRQNNITITNKDNNYNLVGSKFNANSLIDDLISDNDSNNIKFFKDDFNLSVKIDQVYLDKEHLIQNLSGFLNFHKNEISGAELNAMFSKNKKFKFTINTNLEEKVTTLFLDKAEPVVKRYKFIKGFEDGSLDFYSLKKSNKSISNLKIYDFKLNELPILTKLLTLASLQGIADILSGEGITFDEFEMNFNNQNNLTTIDELYAIGPAISILMDGYIEKDKLVSLRGSLVPATTINKAIGTIPILGKILVGSKTGEGVFGVSFKIKGPPKNLETTVNPIKTLTPRFIIRTLEKIQKN